jgi:hypothetical protein
MVNVNKITMDSGGHTITMTQSTAPGIRAMTGVQNQIQYTGTHNGTISHAAISQNLGFFRDTGAIRTLTITNAYSLLLNPLDDYGAGFTFTNRWGIYQAGASDNNYFAGKVLVGSTTDNGIANLQTTGIALNTIASSGATINFSNGVGINLNSGGPSSSFTRVSLNSLFQISSGGSTSRGTIDNIQMNITGTGVANYSSFIANATLTALTATSIYKAFEWTNNSQWGLYGTGTASNYLGGNLAIGTLAATSDWLNIGASTTAKAQIFLAAGTAPTTPTDGQIWFDGTNLFMRIGGLTKTFTII